MRSKSHLTALAWVAVFFVAFTFMLPGRASAIPSFARKYETTCSTCHTVYPMLNSFGEAFRRNGYRFPSQDGSTDGDVTKAPSIPLGQPEYIKEFPEAVWPDKLTQAVPLSVWINGAASFNIPKTDAHNTAGNTFTWNDILSEAHLFGAGAFDDRVTYFTQMTFASDGVDLETAYLLWNDVLGADVHALNLWVGRLMSTSLTSFGGHSSYLNDTATPAVSIVGLYNPSGSFVLGQGHNDGIEANGILGHRVDWSVGWLASTPLSGLKIPNSEDVYAHLGVKLGGMSLDGEGEGGVMVANVKRPWEETSLTLDVFGYHGLNVLDSGTGAMGTPAPQRSPFNALGTALRLNLASFVLNSGFQFESHDHPYQGTPGMGSKDGTPDRTAGHGYTQFNELDYVVFPWFVPGIRTELTHIGMEGDSASLLRIMPGIALLIRANIKVVVVADFEVAHNLPPLQAWDPAGGFSLPDSSKTQFSVEQINGSFAWAF